jgi:hypothetical protein
MKVGNTCVVDPNSGWTLVDVSSDLGGGLIVNKSASPTANCGGYSYFGNLTYS